MKSSQKARFSYLSKVKKSTLISSGASRNLVDKIKRGAKLSPELLKKTMRVYRTMQYRQLRASGLNSPESYRYFDASPSKVKHILKKMDYYVETIVDLNRVENERKKGREEAKRSVAINMGKRKWEFQYIEDYIKERKSASYEEYMDYKAFMKKNGFIHFDEWRKGMQQEKAYKKLFPGEKKK